MANFASLTVPLNNGATYLFGIVLGGLFAYVAFKATRKRITDLPLPPGPMPLPLIGNVLNMPMKDPWETFTKWNTKHGEIVHVSVFNQPIIILNSPRTVSDLLEKRYALYSDRPHLPLVSELDWSLTLMPYNEVWRTHRRVLSSRFGPSTAELFHPAHDFASINLLNNLSLRPEEFEGHIRLYMTQGILMSTYGIIPRTRQDTFVVLAERQLSAVSKVIRPGVFLADAFPIRMIPKGSIIIVNSWGILHNPELYCDPMEFRPERFFDRNGRLDFSRNDPAKFAFGFGRRVCPGHHFAESALHLAISRILAAFDISPAKDKNGVQIPVAHRPLTGAISHSNQFCCTIVPRSLEAKALIQQARENMSQMYNV